MADWREENFSGIVVNHPSHDGPLVYIKQYLGRDGVAICEPLGGGKTMYLPIAELTKDVNVPGSRPLNAVAYIELLREAIKVGWPVHYKDNVTHWDAIILGVHPKCRVSTELPDGMPFGWILRNHGSHIDPANGLPDLTSAKYYVKMDEVGDGTDERRYYWWDGGRLTEVGSASAILEKMAAYKRVEATTEESR